MWNLVLQSVLLWFVIDTNLYSYYSLQICENYLQPVGMPICDYLVFNIVFLRFSTYLDDMSNNQLYYKSIGRSKLKDKRVTCYHCGKVIHIKRSCRAGLREEKLVAWCIRLAQKVVKMSWMKLRILFSGYDTSFDRMSEKGL